MDTLPEKLHGSVEYSAWREMSEVDLDRVADSGAARAGSHSPIMGSGDGENGMTGSGGVTAEEVGGIAPSAVQEGRESSAAPSDPPEQGFPAGTRSPQTRGYARYPLNSRRLTAGHLRTLAKALGLPTAGSPDQLRQCVEGIVQRDHDHRNVVVVVQESLKTEQVIVLEDSEGEFLQCEPITDQLK